MTRLPPLLYFHFEVDTRLIFLAFYYLLVYN